MRILVTAGNTQTPIDDVRCITNIFTGKTGTHIALAAHRGGHFITLLTSHPEVVFDLAPVFLHEGRWIVKSYRTFDDLSALLETEVASAKFDAIIHCAAVSDYRLASITTADGRDAGAGKISGRHAELNLKLVPTPKLIDRFRSDWSFAGTLVKFKLEVGLSEDRLLEVAEASRVQSRADWLVANLFETRGQWAYLGNGPGQYRKVSRADLPAALLRALAGSAP